MPTNSENDDAEDSSQSRLRRAAENLERSLTIFVPDDDAPNDLDSHGGPTVCEDEEPSDDASWTTIPKARH